MKLYYEFVLWDNMRNNMNTIIIDLIKKGKNKLGNGEIYMECIIMITMIAIAS